MIFLFTNVYNEDYLSTYVYCHGYYFTRIDAEFTLRENYNVLLQTFN